MYRMGQEEIDAVTRAIESCELFRYREDSESEAFEKEWAEKIGTRHALVLANGTGALICGLAGMGIGPGDEVIVPAYTFMATPLAVLAVGAVPVLAEIDASLTLDPEDAERKITPRTRAILPVHMCGLPCDMDAIMDLASRHGLKVLEDACQADGGAYKGRRLGSIGDAGAFSFNVFKIITCGEGGALATDDRELLRRATIQHDGGCVFSDQFADLGGSLFAGWNFRIADVLSALLRVQLTRLDDILAALRKEKRIMVEELAGAAAFNPVHDPEGDCGTHLALLLDSPEEVRAYLRRLEEIEEGAASRFETPVEAETPIDSGRHVYCHWEPVMARLGAHHPGRDPYRLEAEAPQSSPDMCPRTLEILARTVYLETCSIRAEDELRQRLAVTRAALPSSAAAVPAASS